MIRKLTSLALAAGGMLVGHAASAETAPNKPGGSPLTRNSEGAVAIRFLAGAASEP